MAAENRKARWTFVLDEPTRILVVDDDPILREFAGVYLATPSATIDTAEDGEAALIKLNANSYDVVLLDIEMPRLDGFSLLARIRADETLRHLPVIMLTGHDDIASIDRAYQVGANSFAAKPVNWRQLSYHIRYVMRANRLENVGACTRSHGQKPESENDPLGPVPARDVGEFLQSVVRRADTFAAQLVAHGDQEHLQLIRNVALFAQQALADHSGASPPGSADGGGRTQPAPLRVTQLNPRSPANAEISDALVS
jgi:two-component system sensor histidine kinase/response regulator